MQVDSGNNYNVLGRTGPIYPRPEYRPTDSSKKTPEETKGGQDKVSVSGGKEGKAQAKARKELKAQTQAAADGRLNVQSAKALTSAIAESIASLPPDGRNQGPHTVKGLGLLPPRYV